MQLLFIADPLESFKTYKDTTFAMMREAQRRGHTISACVPQDIMWQRGAPVQAHVLDIELTGDANDWFRVRRQRAAPLADFARTRPLTANISTPPTCWSRRNATARGSSTSRAPCVTTRKSWRSWSFRSSSAPRW
jgi:glutathione synthase/RimK-type ligase-like ATP-grasp enzyme